MFQQMHVGLNSQWVRTIGFHSAGEGAGDEEVRPFNISWPSFLPKVISSQHESNNLEKISNLPYLLFYVFYPSLSFPHIWDRRSSSSFNLSFKIALYCI